jgi:periplasmic protein TonB
MPLNGRSANGLGWIVSLLIHGLTLGAAIVLAADFSLIPKPRPFQWNVSLVAAPPATSVISDDPSISHTSPVSSVGMDSQISKPRRSQRTQTGNAAGKSSTSQLSSAAPPANLHMETVVSGDLTTGEPSLDGIVGSLGDQAAETAESPNLHRETADDHAEVVPLDLPDLPVSPEKLDESPPPDVDAPVEAMMVSEPAIQEPDRLALRPAPQFRDPAVSRPLHADYGWLANDIFARVEKLKRYPYLAKNNRWQGNVILQAMIAEDGMVSEIEIVESSGHAALDRDAISLLAQVSPISLEYPLGQAHIVVQIPIGYRLE